MSYFVDENGHVLTNKADEDAFVKRHPDLPYGEDPDGPPPTEKKPEDNKTPLG